MLKYLITLLSIFMIGTASAQQSGFGLGIILGEPTGITGKYWTTAATAIDGAAAWAFSHDGAMHLHADYLFHKFDLIKVEKGRLPFYYGIGGRLRFGDGDHHNNDNVLGIRIPVGLNYLFAHDPFDLFFEIVPILDVAPDTEINFNAALGFRYFFK